MSRAFVKEDNGDRLESLPDRPISSLPNYMTPNGHRAMHEQLVQLERELAALKGSEELSQKSRQAHLERDIRYYLARLQSAKLVEPPVHPPDQVRFGCTVTVVDAEKTECRYQIVGEDEADIKQHKISWASPLARSLMNKQEGDTVLWQKPVGAVEIEIIRIES
ncbi:MAG: hypothetical protein ETSY1_01575 [Candidatus Entotheonella factor]|uniref:Transcription elongation factor GreA/GreB C-terminal domain-containing protein n=1 Tax=Entotheonella factor TaxID=1429438 RepID=W4LY40_ENTF1|nr:MAG: hypothetical protein ETSY1_01575 [Candidatus Entotheonella factor]